jgi:hypothetical protein
MSGLAAQDRTAKTRDLAVPLSLLALADEVAK